MLEVVVQQTIRRPAADVFDYIADMSNNTTWQKGMQSCVWTSEPPLRLGSTYDQTARFLGREIVSSFEVTELVPGELIRIETTSGSMPIDVTRTVDRLVGMFQPEVQESVRVRLADCLTAVISLRLLLNKSGLGLLPAVE